MYKLIIEVEVCIKMQQNQLKQTTSSYFVMGRAHKADTQALRHLAQISLNYVNNS